jgi:hypothetical protein
MIALLNRGKYLETSPAKDEGAATENTGARPVAPSQEFISAAFRRGRRR